jgi:hypothetical protein
LRIFGSTLAGKPFERGFQDGPGAVARFNNIARIAVDWHTGDLIVSDRDNHCIRRVILIKEGNMAVVTTIAGGGYGQMGEAGHADARALEARFNSPVGVAVGEEGRIFVGDLCNHCVREISTSGDVTTFAGMVRVCVCVCQCV